MANYPLQLYIVVPEAATNIITNPSFETGTTGWSATAGSIARSSSAYRRGQYALSVTPSANGDVVYYTTTLTSGTTYNLSLDILTINGVTYTIGAVTSAHAFQSSKTKTLVGDGHWQRVWLTFEADGSSAGVGVSSSTSASYYVDGVCLVASTENQLYFDGDLGRNDPASPREYEFRWTGTPHASTSERAGWTRKGGYLLRFSDYARLLTVTGLGLTPYAHAYVQLAGGGALYQDSRRQVRSVAVGYTVYGQDVSEWGAKIAVLQRVLSADLTTPRQPVRTVWVHEDDQGRQMSEAVILDVTVDGGLEGVYTAPTYARGVLTLTAGDPLLTAEATGGISIPSTDSLTVAGILARTPEGEWTTLGATLTGGSVYAFHVSGGYLYIGGSFTAVNSIANTGYFARYHIASGTWSSCSTTTLGGTVYALASGPDGNIYVGGNFSNVGGDASADKLLRYEISTNNYKKIYTTPPSGYIKSLLTSGQTLYASGPCNTIDGVTISGIGQYDIPSGVWSAMSPGFSFLPAAAYSIIEHPFAALRSSRKIMAVGDFAISGIGNYVALWNGSAWAGIGSASSSVYTASVIGGDVYIGGTFEAVGGVTASRVALYDGCGWYALGSGVSGGGATAMTVRGDADGVVWVGGDFTTAGGLPVNGLAVWSGSTWQLPPVTPPSGGSVHVIHAQDGWLFFSTSGAYTVPGSETVSVSAPSYPTFRVSGPDTLLQIRNNRNGQAIVFDGEGLVIGSGETVTITCSPLGVQALSSTRGDMGYSLSPTSSDTLRLEAGGNVLSAHTTGGSDITLTVAGSYMSIEETLR